MVGKFIKKRKMLYNQSKCKLSLIFLVMGRYIREIKKLYKASSEISLEAN